MSGVQSLEEKIAKFEALLEEIKEEQRNTHALLKEVRQEKKEIQRILAGDDIRQMVYDRADAVVGAELDRLAPLLQEHTNKVYDKVGKQIDILINLSLGRPMSTRDSTKDLRPMLAAKLRDAIYEVVTEEIARIEQAEDERKKISSAESSEG